MTGVEMADEGLATGRRAEQPALCNRRTEKLSATPTLANHDCMSCSSNRKVAQLVTAGKKAVKKMLRYALP
jgi:hypothetical protein